MQLTITEIMMETINVVIKKILGIRAIRLDRRSQKPSFTTVGAVDMREAPETLLEAAPEPRLESAPETRLGAPELD